MWIKFTLKQRQDFVLVIKNKYFRLAMCTKSMCKWMGFLYLSWDENEKWKWSVMYVIYTSIFLLILKLFYIQLKIVHYNSSNLPFCTNANENAVWILPNINGNWWIFQTICKFHTMHIAPTGCSTCAENYC